MIVTRGYGPVENAILTRGFGSVAEYARLISLAVTDSLASAETYRAVIAALPVRVVDYIRVSRTRHVILVGFIALRKIVHRVSTLNLVEVFKSYVHRDR